MYSLHTPPVLKKARKFQMKFEKFLSQQVLKKKKVTAFNGMNVSCLVF